MSQKPIWYVHARIKMETAAIAANMPVENFVRQNNLPLEERVPEFTPHNTSSTHDDRSEQKLTGLEYWKDIAKKYAKVLDSRDSITRIFLEFTADIPWLLSAALRNKLSFFETVFETIVSFTSFAIAPFITEQTAKIIGKHVLDSDDQKNVLKLANFYRKELDSEESFQQGIERILKEEPADIRRLAGIYRSTGKSDKAKAYENKAQELEQYFGQLKDKPGLRSKLLKLKERTIIAESSIEGFMWGTVGLLLRFFRSVVLRQKRFTGTSKYLKDEDAKKLGEAKSLALWQKICGGAMAVFSPVVNSLFLKLSKNKELLGNNKWLKAINNQLDMMHGIFPKLGLLFSYTSLPKWISTFITSQGIDELIERVLRYGVIGGSWWMGHKLFNGNLARYYDNQLAKKHGVDKGIIVDQNHLGKPLVEAAKIHQVLDKTEGNHELRKDAEEAHWKTFYGGVSIHSIVIFFMCLAINKLTKWRVERKKEALN